MVWGVEKAVVEVKRDLPLGKGFEGADEVEVAVEGVEEVVAEARE